MINAPDHIQPSTKHGYNLPPEPEEFDRTLTIKEVASLLNLSYSTVFAHRLKWGFFQMEGSRVWRVFRQDLDQRRKKKNNVIRLVGLTDTKNGGKNRCQSAKEEKYIGSILQHQTADALDAALKQK